MKRFDKGCIYSGILSDLIGLIAVFLIYLKDFFLDADSAPEDIKDAIPFFAVGFAVVFLCFIVYRILYYKTSGYEFTDTEIKCNRGVLFKKRSVLEYRRIHAVNKRQGLLHRIFGVAVLTVDSGSTNTSFQAEITIIEKSAAVDALLDRLSEMKNGCVQSADRKEELLLSEEDGLYRFTSARKMVYTLISIVSTAFFTVLFAVLSVAVLAVCKLILKQSFLGTWGQYFLYALLITLGAVLLFSIFSLIGYLIHSFVGYYNFTITKRGSDIRITYGLIEKHTNTFSYDRIKAVKITQGLVQRMLGFASVRLEVIGYTGNAGDDGKNADIGVLVPFCRYSEVGEILAKVLPDYVPDEKQTESVSYFPFVSWFLSVLGIVTGTVLAQLAVTMLLLDVASPVIFAALLTVVASGCIVFAVKALSAALAYRTDGLAVNGAKITAYSGGFTKNVTVFMRENLIASECVTTPLREKAGITSLVMHLKTNASSNEIKVNIQKDGLSEELEKLLIL